MVNQVVWITLSVSVFAVGMGVGYIVFANMNEMTSEDGVENESVNVDNMMGSNPIEEHEIMLEMVEKIVEDEDLREHMMAHLIENQKSVHQMLTFMTQNPELKRHMEAHVTGNLTGYETLDG